ncbi:HAMP domain-containing sensor histidine kinase [Dolichospermum planctonicum CS-1226]|uniref:histidine kinase n=1 Tax=Dolichospermum planctonicum CS-1226 TaxID=3021751 RepID=A0ABT5AFI0_9CYAN|nr:HAMP domain-containing sensor histidine kinase [Dolichospermum planctonicum]MDB9536048.1 HAMP domain-containing sensor histidine kinase [Dolichospermum planctonicum CS-1226]
MYKWILPSLKEVLSASQSPAADCSTTKAEHQWRVSLAATENLLLGFFQSPATTLPHTTPGLVLAAPAPLFSHPELTQHLQTITFTAKPFNPLALMPFIIPSEIQNVNNINNINNIKTNSPETPTFQESILPLLPADPLAAEQFCLVFTDEFRLVIVLSELEFGQKEFLFSFEPEIVQQAWQSLGSRVVLTNPELFADLDSKVQNYPLVAPNYQTIVQFSKLLLQELTIPEVNPQVTHTLSSIASPTPPPKHPSRPDVELLQAFAHEVRTPLTTIRMMTRLLLKRQDLPVNVISRLEVIDHECTDQIDRMELLFKAAELENLSQQPLVSKFSQAVHAQLTPMCLDQVLKQSIPRWQQAATRRNLTLNVVLPKQLPTVVSNPAMLDRVLTGLMENFTRSLPPGSCIQVQVMTAGDQLKLQLSPQFNCQDPQSSMTTPPIRKSLGQLLMFQPETGAITLNIAATKHLFQAIGGKLIVRQRPHNGEVLTIFLPVES